MSTTGPKFDSDKVDMSLFEFLPRALTEVGRTMDYGQAKYSRGSFLEVPKALQRYRAARNRHQIEVDLGNEIDSGDPFYETEEGKRFKGKLLHRAQIAVNALFELEIWLREQEKCKEKMS